MLELPTLGDPALGQAPCMKRAPSPVPPSAWDPSEAGKCRHLNPEIVIVSIKGVNPQPLRVALT